jgi:hypothetical protein
VCVCAYGWMNECVYACTHLHMHVEREKARERAQRREGGTEGWRKGRTERGNEGRREGGRGVTGRTRENARAFVGLIVSPSFPNEVVPPRFTCVWVCLCACVCILSCAREVKRDGLGTPAKVYGEWKQRGQKGTSERAKQRHGPCCCL